LKTDNFDPLQYIENAFLDTRKEREPALVADEDLDLAIPSIVDYIDAPKESSESDARVVVAAENPAPRGRFRKTVMSAPRPRRARQSVAPSAPVIDPDLQSVWQTLPKSVEFLCSFYDDSVTANYYRGEFKESRQDLIRRLLDPELSLEETSRLLGVCPATVRRYTNRGWLTHHRTGGGQRRFRLSDIVKFVDEHGRFPEA
jgi:excisionase family DNA binding protein